MEIFIGELQLSRASGQSQQLLALSRTQLMSATIQKRRAQDLNQLYSSLRL